MCITITYNDTCAAEEDIQTALFTMVGKFIRLSNNNKNICITTIGEKQKGYSKINDGYVWYYNIQDQHPISMHNIYEELRKEKIVILTDDDVEYMKIVRN